MTSVAQTPTPTTREEMVSYFNSEDRSQVIRLRMTIEDLLEFELNNWEPIHTSCYSWKDEDKEPPVDGPKLLDLLRQTFTWKENICVWTDVSFEGDQRVAVRCKDRSDYLQKMSSSDISSSIGFGEPGDEEEGSDETYVDPLEIDLYVSSTRTYAPEVDIRDLQLKVNPKEQGLEVFRQTLLKMKDEDLKLMSHLSAEDFLSTVENVQDLALSASSKD